MQHSGLREAQVAQVRGYADQMLRLTSNPLDASNRRISVIVQYQEKKD
jgi:chemotaxis protein MotB